MKQKTLIITTLLFFIAVNTSYFWEGKLDLYAFPAFIFLFVCYIILLIVLIRQLYFFIKERPKQKQRLLLVGLLIIVLTTSFLKPTGLIDFDKWEGDDVLVAGREGVANCYTYFKLKDDYTFKQKSICFGISDLKGTYRLVNDTIYFEKVQLGRTDESYPAFAVIKPTESNQNEILGSLYFYNDKKSDSMVNILSITKMDLTKLNPQGRHR